MFFKNKTFFSHTHAHTKKIHQNIFAKKLKSSTCGETQTLKSLKKNSKTQIVMKLKNLNCDETPIVMKLKTQIVLKLKNSNFEKIQTLKL